MRLKFLPEGAGTRISYNGTTYWFNKENNWTQELPQDIIDYVFKMYRYLRPRMQVLPSIEEQVKEDIQRVEDLVSDKTEKAEVEIETYVGEEAKPVEVETVKIEVKKRGRPKTKSIRR